MQKTKPNELAAAKMVGGRCFGVTVTVRFWMSMVDRVWGPVSILIRYLEQGTSRVTFVVPPEVSRLPPGYGILNEGDLNKCSEETVILQKKLKNLRTQQPGDRVTVTHCKGTWSFRPTTSIILPYSCFLPVDSVDCTFLRFLRSSLFFLLSGRNCDHTQSYQDVLKVLP